MSLRESLDLIRMVKPEAGTTALDHEIMAERASSLGAAEHKVVATLAVLAAATGDATALQQARNAVWAYFVQRELIGFRKHADVIQHLGIPPQVLVGLGAFETR